MLLDGSYFGHHMMDWDLTQMIPMIFGGITIIIAIIVILYIILQSTRRANEKSQMIIQAPMSKQNELNIYEKDKDDSEDINFCFNCGTKLYRNQLRYCPNCGTKL